MSADPLINLQILSRVFDEMGIGYFVGGSMASAVYGEYRATQDVDFVADFQESHIPGFVAALQEGFYVDDEMIRDAIQTQTSFNVINLDTMYKADIFILKTTAWAREEMRRRERATIILGEESVSLFVTSKEDIVLQKLAWFRLGGGVSERQWRDVQGVLKVQAGALDYDYLRRWAQEQGLTDLLEQAIAEAGV